jgi:type I restriction enzyme S subunit
LDFDLDRAYVSLEDHQEIYRRCDPVLGDVIYIKDGVTTGIAAVNRYDFEFSMLSSLAILRPNKAKVNSEYLCAYLNAPSVKANILRQMAGGAIKRLTVAKLKKLTVVAPPLNEQWVFAAVADKVRGLRTMQRESEKELDNLFNCLMQRAFRGELVA